MDLNGEEKDEAQSNCRRGVAFVYKQNLVLGHGL